MKKLKVVFLYELNSYLKNKSFMITTIVLTVILGFLTFLPRFFDMSSILGTSSGNQQIITADTTTTVIQLETANMTTDESNHNSVISESEPSSTEYLPYTHGTEILLYDPDNFIADKTLLQALFPSARLTLADDKEVMIAKVEAEEVDGAFEMISANEYSYYVFNKDMNDSNMQLFNSALTSMAQVKYCEDNSLDYTDFNSKLFPIISGNDIVLGKAAGNNFWYSYAFVMIIFMAIMLYGIMIATSVTQEKSNRSIELLVTSTNPNLLMFGKVFAGAVAGVGQIGIILASCIIGYSINRDAWGNTLDMALNIPAEVLIIFFLFGLGGFLFYAFLYSAMGALVSKTEDLNKSAGGLHMIVMLVYFVVMSQLSSADGIIMKVASFLPFSSYSTMFVRVAMGKVEVYEIVTSFVILAASIVLVGILGAKVYRMGTLRYGNPISLKAAIGSIKKDQ